MAVGSSERNTVELELEREPDVERGLRLVRLLFERIRELDDRVELLEREQRRLLARRQRG